MKIARFLSALAAGLPLACPSTAPACTRVLWNSQDGYVLSARNLDFFGPTNPSLVISPRGVARIGGTGEDEKNAARWTARYGSVAIYADDAFPMDGVNEKGLAAHTLYFTAGAEAPIAGAPAKPVLESSHWLSFILDNHASVAEAVDAIAKVRLLPKRMPIDYASDTKHIAIEDASGDSAVIEIVRGVTKIYHGRQYTVMTNPPDYEAMMALVAKNLKDTPSTVPQGWEANARLVRAHWLLQTLPRPTGVEEARGFLSSIMHSVAMPIGLMADPLDIAVEKAYEPYSKYPQLNRGIGTYWTSTTDFGTMRYAFQAVSSISPIWLDLKKLDFSENSGTRAIRSVNLYGDNGWTGDVSGQMQTAPAYR